MNDILKMLKESEAYNGNGEESKKEVKEVKEKVLAKPGEVIIVDELAEMPRSLWQKLLKKVGM